MTLEKEQLFFLISDAVGDTARQVTHAALAQYTGRLKAKIRRFPFVNSTKELEQILNDAKNENAIVAATFVNKDLDQFAKAYAQKNHLEYVNYLSKILESITRVTELAPLGEAGTIRQVNDQYMHRMSAVEFAIKCDDGNNTQKGLVQADIVILGVSRSSKTPLSLYLANRGYLVANYPLIPEVQLPEILSNVPAHKIFGLLASPAYIQNIRTNRLKYLGLTQEAKYCQLERIQQEIHYAQELYHTLKAQVIDIEYKSIEETGAEIIEFLQDHADNLYFN